MYDLNSRALSLAKYVVRNKATVRQTAEHFNITKSLVHIDITQRLAMLNPMLAQEVRKVLEKNKAESHIRGGMATKKKYSTAK